MTRVWLLLSIVDVAFMIFAFVDVLLTQPWRVRTLPKIVWVILVLLISPIGGILWFTLGKERLDSAAAPRQIHPDDDPEFLARMRREKDDQDERIAQLEKELADLDDDQSDPRDNKGK